MKTIRLYYSDSDKEQHQAIVTAIHSDEHGIYIELNETIFHPQGGGQPTDLGTINNHQVLRVFEREEAIFHQIQEGVELSVGEEVALKIDLQRRQYLAKLHSGGHLIAHLIERKYPELKAIRGHHFPNQARVEFALASGEGFPDKKTVEKDIKQLMVEAISEKLPIQSMYNQEEGRRISIGDFEETPCGGTHVSHTGELEDINIRSVKVRSGTLRVGYQC